MALEQEEQAGHECGDDGPLEQDAQGVDPGKVVVGRYLHAQQRKDAGEQQAQDGGDERFAHKGAAQAGELAGGGGGVGRGERKDARGDAVACDAGPSAAGEDGVGQDEHHKGERLVLSDEAHGAPNSQKDLEQAEGDAPPKSAFGNGARLSANGLGLAQDKVDGRRKTDERDGGSEHAETPHKLKRTKAGVYPIVTKICAAIGVCAQQPAILTRTCGGVAQCSGDLRDNGRELHGNVKAS